MKPKIILVIFFLLSSNLFAENLPYYYSDTNRAIDYYKSCISQDANNTENYLNLASLLVETGKNAEAAGILEQALKITGYDEYLCLKTAECLYLSGKFQEAETFLRVGIQKNTTLPEYWFWLGNCLLEQNKSDEALNNYQKFFEYSKNAVAYLKIGQANEAKEDYDRAIENYNKTMERDRSFVELNMRIAEIYEKKGNTKDAYMSWKKMSETDSKNKIAAEKVTMYASAYDFAKDIINKRTAELAVQRASLKPTNKKSISNSENVQKIKIGLIKNADKIGFRCSSAFAALDKSGNMLMTGEEMKEYLFKIDGGKYYIADGNTLITFQDEITIEKREKEAVTTVYDVHYADGFFWSQKKDSNYRGEFIIRPTGTGLTLINLINTEEYLYGLIASEMPGYWPEEALKAQAVSARTYTLRNLGKHNKDGYDICCQQHCAVYEGVNRELEITIKAVDSTHGEVLKTGSGLADLFYHDNCGGHTEKSSDIWGVKGTTGVYDGEDEKWANRFPLSPYWLEKWVKEKPDAYCKIEGKSAISYRWFRYLSGFDLLELVKRIYDSGRIKTIRPIKRSPGGTLLEAEIEGEKGNKIIKTETIKNILGKARSGVLKWEYLRDQEGFIKEIYVWGAGWGHNAGMCQTGAYGMSKKNKKYAEILLHYFPEDKIVKIY